jgi:hypothetical protein
MKSMEKELPTMCVCILGEINAEYPSKATNSKE